jgi:Fic family protein
LPKKRFQQGFDYPVPISLSQAIEANKKLYYAALNEASKSNEITPWIQFFVDIILKAQVETELHISFILKKGKILMRLKINSISVR